MHVHIHRLQQLLFKCVACQAVVALVRASVAMPARRIELVTYCMLLMTKTCRAACTLYKTRNTRTLAGPTTTVKSQWDGFETCFLDHCLGTTYVHLVFLPPGRG